MNNGQHLSASQRRILQLEAELAKHEASKAEYMALMHYLIATNGGEHYDVLLSEMKKLQENKTLLKGVCAEKIKREDGERVLRLSVVEPAEPSRIIIPK